MILNKPKSHRISVINVESEIIASYFVDCLKSEKMKIDFREIY